jgi:hypothetical protein
MPRIGVSITKSTSFRNGIQEFSNVYYYEMGTLPDGPAASALADNLVSLEKTFHSTAVTFVRKRVWHQTGDKATTEMIHQANLTGTGARSLVPGMDKERAYLFRLAAGADSRGNPVYLRKWYHSCGQFVSAIAPGGAVLENNSGFTTGERSSFVTAMQTIGDAAGSAGVPKLCAKGGRLATVGANWSAHQFLEHHQLGDQWRAQ